MYIQIKDWLINTDKIRAIGIYESSPCEISIEYSGGNDSRDEIGFKTAEEAKEAIKKIAFHVGALKIHRYKRNRIEEE